jgi:hypothetical protein
MFKHAFTEALAELNIKLALAKTSIWPMNKDRVIKVIQKPITSPIEFNIDSLKTPLTSKGIRQFQCSYREEPTQEEMAKLFPAKLQLSAVH